MPLYEFECRQCGEIFERMLSLKELEEGPLTCPSCGSGETSQRLGSGIIQVGLGGYKGKVQ